VYNRLAFGWFVLASTVAIAIFISGATYLDTRDHLEVYPVAYVNPGKGNPDVRVGYLAAEGSDRLYLSTKPQGGELVELAKDGDTQVQVASATSLSEAPERAVALAESLCRLLVADRPCSPGRLSRVAD
jgi:hypothetical protein